MRQEPMLDSYCSRANAVKSKPVGRGVLFLCFDHALKPRDQKKYEIVLELSGTMDGMSPRKFAGGSHALEHALIKSMNELKGRDLGLSGNSRATRHGGAFISVFDDEMGGELMFELFSKFEKVVLLAKERLLQCACRGGCFGCVKSRGCVSDNRTLDKDAALEICKRLAGGKGAL